MTNRIAIVVEQENGTVSRPFFYCDTLLQANTIANHMNMLNATAAKMTGKAITLVYKVFLKG